MRLRTIQIGNEDFAHRQGGLGRVYHELSRHLPGAGVDFRGFVIGDDRENNKNEANIQNFAQSHDPTLVKLLKLRRCVRAQLKAQTPDAIACHFGLFALPLLDQLTNIPLVIHFHGPWAAEANFETPNKSKYRLKKAIECAVYKRARRIIVLSCAFKKELVDHYEVSPEIIRIVPGGIDLRRFDTRLTRLEARQQLKWPEHDFIVVAVRRLVKRMGLMNLVLATKSLAKRFRGMRVFIVGTGPEHDELHREIQSAELTETVFLTGRLSEQLLPLAFRAANLSIVPSLALEGFGMITLESLASGTPVMVAPVGGLPEVVSPLSTSLILHDPQPSSIEAGLANAMSGQVSLPTDSECREYVARNFGWELIARQTRAIYEEAIYENIPQKIQVQRRPDSSRFAL